MKLRFELDQAEALRRGIETHEASITIEVDLATLPENERHLLAVRMNDIDVMAMRAEQTFGIDLVTGRLWSYTGKTVVSGTRIKASEPTYEALIQAVRQDEVKVRKEIAEHHRQ